MVVVALAVALACAGCAPASDPPAGPTTSSPSGTVTPTPTASGPVTRIAVVGDSLSRGFDACAHYGDCPSVSWAGGDDPRIRSVATRIGEAVGGPVRVQNLAKSGSTVADLSRQVSLAITTRPDLLTVLIGANDVCRATVDDMTSTADYTDAVSVALQGVATLSPDTVILVASVPDVPAILPAAATDPTARFLWERAGGCRTVLAHPQSTTRGAVERRLAVSERIGGYDAALAGVCAGIPRCVSDGGALNAYRPTFAQLSSLDAFHPSVAGLREIARLEWRALKSSERASILLDR